MLTDLARLCVANGRWWLVPLVAVLAGTSLLVVALQVVEYVAPFVYSLF
jgi:hypothetical protein